MELAFEILREGASLRSPLYTTMILTPTTLRRRGTGQAFLKASTLPHIIMLDAGFGQNVGKIFIKWKISKTFQIRVQYILAHRAKMY